MLRINEDFADLVFRVLFSTIFVALGFEHLFSDALLQALMPKWASPARLVSVACGAVLLIGGLSIMLGYKIRLGATMLLVFLVIVTCVVHGPGLIDSPTGLPNDWKWLWTVYQRSNFVKNICLLGVCVHLIIHQPGRFSLDDWIQRRQPV